MTRIRPDRRRAAPGLVLAAVLATAAGAPAGEWPQYRGPSRDGISAETGLLTSWPEDGPEVLWTAPLGSGYSSVAVCDGRVFTLFGADGSEWAAAFDAATGRELWRHRLGRNRSDPYGDGPRSTPTVDGGRLYVLGATARLAALDAATGEPLWSRDLGEELGARVPEWGVSGSPLVEGGLLIVDAAGRGGHGAVAFDKATGEIVWHAGSHRPAYASPLAVTLGGLRQIVLFTAEGLRGLAADNGEELWTAPWRTPNDVNAAMPIFIPASGLFVSSGYGTGAALFQVVREESGFKVYQVWRSGRAMRNHFNSSVLVGQHIYGFDDGTLKAIEALTGETAWTARRGYSKGSLLYADGHLIVLGGDGTLGLVEADPGAFKEKARARVLDSRTWTVPALAAGVLYVRDFERLVALRVGRSEATAGTE